MKTRILTTSLVGVTALLCLGGIRTGAADAEPADATEVRQLREPVKKLQDRVNTLETQVKQLQARPLAITVFPTPGASNLVQRIRPPLVIPPAVPPRIWGQGECNGWTFYYVPLSQK